MNDDIGAFAARRGRISEWLKERGIAAAVFEDREGRRDPTIRYLSGQPGDSLLVVTAAVSLLSAAALVLCGSSRGAAVGDTGP